MTTALNNASWPSGQAGWVEEAKKQTDGKKFFPLTPDAEAWLTSLTQSVQNAPQEAGIFVEHGDENDAIPATDISGTGLTEGFYQALIYSRVTDPDPVSSSVQVTLTWTDGGVIQTFVGTLVNGNLTTSKSQQAVPLFVDGGTALTYETAYASNTANDMHYELYISLQLIKAVAG